MATWSRYREVLGSLSAGDLARLAWRRTYRNAHQQLARTRLFATAEQALVDGQSLDQLLAGGASDWWRAGHRGRVIRSLKHFPAARAQVLHRAQHVLEGERHYFGHAFHWNDADPNAWHRDAPSGFVWARLPVAQLRLQAAGRDPKFPWAVGRLDEAVWLAQGVWASDDLTVRASFLAGVQTLVRSFLASNPVGVGVQWACPMDVALRAANLAQMLAMLGEERTLRESGFAAEVLTSLTQHLHFVDVNREDAWSVPNNHLISNLVGMAVVGALFPALPRAHALAVDSVRKLEEELNRQVHEDGYAFEGSVPYHRLSVELFTLGFLAAQAAGVPFSLLAEARLRRMFDVVQAYTSEKGRAPQIGDNDSGRALVVGDLAAGAQSHHYLLPLGAALFDVAPWMRARSVPPEVLWLLGDEGVQRLQDLAAAPKPALPRSFSSPEGGLHVLRGAGAVLSVSAGPSGQRGVGGHNHNDRLGFELHLEGIPLVVDPGTGTYTREPAVRNALRSTAAHSTPQLDGEEQSPFEPAQLFALPDHAACAVDELRETPTVLTLRAHHHGYRRLAGKITVRRSWVLDELAHALAVEDTLEGAEEHDVVERFHLAPDVEVVERPATDAELARARSIPGVPAQLGPTAYELQQGGQVRATLLASGVLSARLTAAPFSPSYGELGSAPLWEGRARLRAPSSLVFVFLFFTPSPRKDARQ